MTTASAAAVVNYAGDDSALTALLPARSDRRALIRYGAARRREVDDAVEPVYCFGDWLGLTTYANTGPDLFIWFWK